MENVTFVKLLRKRESNELSTPVECRVKQTKHNQGERVDPTFFKSLVGSLCYLTCTRPYILNVIGLVSTIYFGLFYSSSDNYKLVGYSNNDWAGDSDDRKALPDLFSSWETLHSHGWRRSNQLSHYLPVKLNTMPQDKPTEIYVDNKSAIALAKNPVIHDRSKHIDTRYHYIRECIARKDVQVEYVKSQDQVTDIFTKPLKQEDFVRLWNSIGITRQD
ncbi:hypothetical protein DVH24_042434 [Malus domestica]|uniref:Reverse transcriptase Ty1/copia-type domain-containing protein n=1 Tax=Malus domestica TaxID=3750 RepID=A0A498J3D4_MALDO|nr:hypothetical protein DVH24_042434 [Malus domestica]